jgi:predicted CXXCH cytochrome family protein
MIEGTQNTRMNTWNRLALLSAIIIVLSVPLYFLLNHTSPPSGPELLYGQLHYTGGETCIECHQKEFELWKDSDHDLAMAHATAKSVVGDFNDISIEFRGETHRFYKRDSSFFVFTDGPDGEMQEFEVKYTFGIRPLQQYLVEFSEGRLQCLPLTWDVNKNEWYHMADTVYSGEIIDHANWLHWTNQAQNWNGMCADCHSTQLKKGFDIVTDTFNTTWLDINVNCEACHGPGSEHIKWAKLPEMARLADDSYGLMVQTNNLDNRQYVDRCARCHARRSVFMDFPSYHTDLLDYMTPTLLIEPYYFADGQILEEDYVYASFTHSKMYMTDIKCNDCHDAHSLKLKMEAVTANDLCLDCHRSDIYDTYDHHFHKKTGEEGNALIAGDSIYDVGSGSLCVNCHMTGRYFMGVDFRRDHSFRIPRPDLTLSTGSPNACNGCHSENTAEWSVSYIDKWYGLSRRPHFATVFASARRGEVEANEGLINIALDELFPVIVRATAIYELQNYNDSMSRQAVIRSMSDPESMIRHEAVQSYIPVSTEEMMQLLTPMLNDPVKAVRMQSAFRMSSIPVDQMDSSILREFYESLDEYREAMEYTGEFSASRHNLGVIYQNLGKHAEAESNFLAAIRIDDQFYPSMANLAVTYNNLGKNDEAETLLRKMIKDFPEYHDAHYSLGLLLAEKGDYSGALKELETATELVPDYSRIWYNLAMLYQHFGRENEYLQAMENALILEPQNLDYMFALADYYYRVKNYEDVHKLALKIKEYYPDIPLGQELLDLVGNTQ